MIRPARAEDAEAVSALAIRSKAGWGYSEDLMAVFREELTVTGERLVELKGQVAEREGEMVGYYTLEARSSEEVELEHMFVAPEVLREGIGSALMAHAVARARECGFKKMKIIADPHATEFYERQGAVRIGEHQSSIPGRRIPILELGL